MACIEVHGYVGEVELLNGVGHALFVCRFGGGTLGNVEVGDEIGKTVRFWSSLDGTK